jgi:glycosyltransferase involved in cell wall biosynthesis
VLTRQTALAQSELGDQAAEVRSAAPEAVPSMLHRHDIGLCLIHSSFSKRASAPTRFAEHLASGMPVVVTPGVGDLEAIVEEERVGVVLRSEDDRALTAAAERLRALAADPGVAERCRSVAEARFSLSGGVDRYADLYRRLTAT